MTGWWSEQDAIDLELILDKMEREEEPPKFTGGWIPNSNPDKKNCIHKWVKVGQSPFTGQDWVNCEKCDMAKEKYDKSR